MEQMQFPGGEQVKSFWERTEGTVGMFGIVGLGIAGFLGLGLALPFILSTLQLAISTVGAALTLIPLALALFIALKIIFDKKVHTLAWYFYKSAIWKLTDKMIKTLDPIVIMKNYVADLEEKREEMQEQILALAAQHTKLRVKIEKKKAEFEAAMKKAGAARDAGKQAQFTLQARRAGRRQKSAVTLEQLYKKIEMLLRTLKKYAEVSDIVIADIDDQVKHQQEERDMIVSAHNAMTRAMSVIHGDVDKLEIFNRAMEIVAEEYGQKLGEIEHFMETSQSFIESVDLDNMVYEQEALEQLEAWEAKADSLLLPVDEKQTIIRDANDDAMVYDVEAAQREMAKPRSRYDSLLKR